MPHGRSANSQVSAASCKLVPLGRATFCMLKLVNFARVPSFFGSNCYVIISIRIFIFALKHQLDLNTWVCQYLNKVMTIIQYGAIQYYRDTLEMFRGSQMYPNKYAQ